MQMNIDVGRLVMEEKTSFTKFCPNFIFFPNSRSDANLELRILIIHRIRKS